jgi:mRNA interferase MazF
MAYIPGRGDVVWLMFDPLPFGSAKRDAGHEQAGRRPALVISPKAYNAKTGLSIVCPITSQVKGYAFEVGIPPGYPASGVILADQIKSLDWRARKAEPICTLAQEITDDVIAKIIPLLD